MFEEIAEDKLIKNSSVLLGGYSLSVSTECRTGDRIFIIEGFISKLFYDDEGNFDISQSKELTIGDSVCFIEHFDKQIGDNQFTMIRYMDNTGEDLEAVETYFVTEDVWNNLMKYFSNKN